MPETEVTDEPAADQIDRLAKYLLGNWVPHPEWGEGGAVDVAINLLESFKGKVAVSVGTMDPTGLTEISASPIGERFYCEGTVAAITSDGLPEDALSVERDWPSIKEKMANAVYEAGGDGLFERIKSAQDPATHLDIDASVPEIDHTSLDADARTFLPGLSKNDVFSGLEVDPDRSTKEHSDGSISIPPRKAQAPVSSRDVTINDYNAGRKSVDDPVRFGP